jgi:hypothetical protein
MKRICLGLLTTLLLTPALHASRISFEELATTDGYVRKNLSEISAPGFRETLDLLEREQGITARSDSLVAAEPTGEVLVTELDDPRDHAKRLFFFFLTSRNESFFLQVSLGPDGAPEMRLWAAGPSEIVISREGVRLVPNPTGATFRLSRHANLEKISVTDTIACIARGLGISLDSSSLTSRLASAVCSETSAIALVLTACNCLSIPSAGPALIFGTIGCVNGITKLIACNIASCTSTSCGVTTINFNLPVSSSWASSCASTHRSGKYAKFYSFILTTTTTVTINLTSPVDAYLYLLQGSGTGGAVLASDDDGGGGTNSRIVRTLGPGSYTIEATTYSSGQTGSFTLSLTR